MSKRTRDIPYSISNTKYIQSVTEYQDPYKSSFPMDNPPNMTRQLRTNPMKQAKSRPKKNLTIAGRDDKVESDLYYKVKDENEELKKTKLEMNDRIKKMEVELANIKSNLVKERRLADRKVIKMDKGYDLDLESTKLENDKLKEQNTKLKTYIKGLQSDTKFKDKKLRPITAAINNSKKNPLQGQKERNESLALIAHLRNEIKDLQDDRRNLVSQLLNMKNQKPSKNNGKMTPDQVTEIEKNNLKLESNQQMMELYKKGLNDYKDKYEEERTKNQQLNQKINSMEMDLERLEELKALNEEYKKREKVLENRIAELCDDPFIKQAETKGNLFKKYQEAEKNLTETEKKLRELEISNKDLEKDYKKLKTEYDLVVIDKEKAREDLIRFKISNEEKEKNKKLFEDNMNMIGGQYGGIDSSYINRLNQMYKNLDQNNPWNDINMLQPYTPEQMKDPEFLFKETERLKIEKGILGKELERTNKLLEFCQEQNEDYKKVQEVDNRKHQAEIKNYKKKIEELCKLIDIERLPKEYLVSDGSISGKILTKADLINNLKVSDDKNNYILNDAITEFSQDSTEPEFSMNENALDIYFGECEFEEGIEEFLGMSLNKLMTFISVDFFIHETQTSNVANGKIPMINLQCTFRVNVDEHFLNFLESDYVNIEVYYLKDNVQSILGRGKIALSDLISIEKSTKSNSRVINSICTINFAKDENIKAASIHYKMRMRNQISEILRWYHEKNRLITELNPVHKVMQDKAEKTMKNYAFQGGKVYQVKILITQATNLIVTGPPRKILPYFYYRFFENEERYSKVLPGNSPEFKDVATYTVSYDHAFHDYVENDNLNVYIFDSSEPIEVDCSNKDNVKLVEENTVQDIIGVCRIPLNGLLVQNLVRGNFPIENTSGQNVGELTVNIFWDEVPIRGKKDIQIIINNDNSNMNNMNTNNSQAIYPDNKGNNNNSNLYSSKIETNQQFNKNEQYQNFSDKESKNNSNQMDYAQTTNNMVGYTYHSMNDNSGYQNVGYSTLNNNNQFGMMQSVNSQNENFGRTTGDLKNFNNNYNQSETTGRFNNNENNLQKPIPQNNIHDDKNESSSHFTEKNDYYS